jgi:hypothetical protein
LNEYTSLVRQSISVGSAASVGGDKLDKSAAHALDQERNVMRIDTSEASAATGNMFEGFFGGLVTPSSSSSTINNASSVDVSLILEKYSDKLVELIADKMSNKSNK